MGKRRTQGDAWEDQARKCLDTIRKFAETPSMQGAQWQLGMVRHYYKSLLVLTNSAPRGKASVRRAILEEADQIIAQFSNKFS